MSKRGAAAQVGTYLGPRAFYANDMRKKEKNWQNGDLPPRCDHPGCRRSWDTVVIDGLVHCDEHRKSCDGECGRSTA